MALCFPQAKETAHAQYLARMLLLSASAIAKHNASVAAITLTKFGEHESAQDQFARFESMYSKVSKEVQTADTDVVQQRQMLMDALHQG